MVWKLELVRSDDCVPIERITLCVARQSGSESPTIRIRIRDCDVAIVFLLFVAGKRYV
jgi:hypothetical protein